MEHMGLWVVIGLVVIIVGTITSVKTILKIYSDNLKNDEDSPNNKHTTKK